MYKGGRSHTAKIKNRIYDVNVSKNTDDGVYVSKVGNKTYKMKASPSKGGRKARAYRRFKRTRRIKR